VKDIALHLERELRFKFPRFDLIGRNPQTWSGLKACMCCGVIAFPVIGLLSGRDRVTHGTHLPNRTNFAASKYYAKAAEVLESGWIGASLDIYHFSAKRVHNGARMANGALTAPTPRIFSHSLTADDKIKCCAWLGLEMGGARGRKS